MIKPVVAMASAAVLALALPLHAAPQGGGRHAGPPGGIAGPAYAGGRPGRVHVGERPGYVGYPGYRGSYGWRGGYWGPRIGFYYGGPGYWGGSPGYWGAWPGAWGAVYSYTYPYESAPIVVNPTPQTQLFMQQQPEAAAASPPAAPELSYWYYCIQPAGYFPYVKDCSRPWLKVVPQAPGEQPSAPQLAP